MHGEYKMPGGKLVVVDLDIEAGRLARVRLSGDFFLEPDSALGLIDTALEGLAVDIPVAALAAAVTTALPASTMMYGVSADAIAMAVQRAVHGGDAA